MEEIEVWTVDGSQVSRLAKSNQMESELLLEDVLVENPGLLLEDLILVGRQTPTEGGPLDLLGVDGDGRLVVFELKRGTLSRDAVAQVVDYASDLDGMSIDVLSDHISCNSGNYGIDQIEDFQTWYTNDLGFEDFESLKPLRMFLVGLGADDRTQRMVRFLAENSGMDISLLTFHGFQYAGKIILAKQVEVEGPSPDLPVPQQRSRYVSRAERWRRLTDRIEEYGVSELFSAVRKLFEECWHNPVERPGITSLGIRLRNRTSAQGSVAYVRVDPESGRIRIVFYPRAIELWMDAFRQPIEQVPFQTWPKGREEQALQIAKTEIQFLLTADDWEAHREKLTELVRTVYQAWENQGADSESGSS